MSRYEPLTRFLTAQRTDAHRMTFRALEEVMGRPLPPSARAHQAWWANTASHTQAESWLRAGWRTQDLDLAGEKVTFVRDPTAAPGVQEPNAPFRQAAGEELVISLDALTGPGLTLLHVHAREHGVSLEAAAATLINEQGREFRQRLLARLAARRAGVVGSNSADLIREDRDDR